MAIPSLLVLAGILLLYAGGESLVRGSAALAGRLGLTPLVIGLTVVAFGTSMPELFVSLGAALNGNFSIATGNVVGSNIANIGLILGLAALIRPPQVKAQLIRVDVPLLFFVSILSAFFFIDGRLNRLEGFSLLGILLIYGAFSLRISRQESGRVKEEFAEAAPRAPSPAWVDPVMILGGLALLALGARLMVRGAVSIAQGLGISQAVIGLSIVAVGTSLPELAASVVAAVRREGDIAIGNVVGSNIFNILGVLGVSSLARPIQHIGIGTTDLLVMIGLTIIILPLMRTGYRVSRWEGGILLGIYLLYAASLYR